MRPFHCKRCGHAWVPRKDNRPKQCPGCRSPYWDRERIRTDYCVICKAWVDEPTTYEPEENGYICNEHILKP